MPRLRRYELVDISQHVIQRGHNRQPTFFESRDYRYYLECVADAAARYHCEIHAYVLMTNHVHLLITPRQPLAIAGFMQSVGGRYVKYVNRRYRRSGTLWGGRYRASLVSTGAYLTCCYRYIELNPVRANMVGDPAAYAWSSYRHNAGHRVDALVTEHAEYCSLGTGPAERAAAYRDLFRDVLDPALTAQLRRDLNESRPFGSEQFKDQVERELKRPLRRGNPGRRKGKPDQSEM